MKLDLGAFSARIKVITTTEPDGEVRSWLTSIIPVPCQFCTFCETCHLLSHLPLSKIPNI